MKSFKHFGLFFLLLTSLQAFSQDARAIIKRANDRITGETSQAELKMTIQRPTWSRDIQIKSWSKDDDYALILITAPARERGTAFLKRERELWNWQPSIDRTIKLPPSMMMQSWMGSDFTNDDLVRESSTVEDYTHELMGEEEVNGRMCYKIALTPKPDAPVVWGKVLTWISKEHDLTLKTEFYDEDGYLVNTMYGKDVKMLGGKLLPSVLEVIPADEEEQKTVIEYLDITFDQPIKDAFFSIQNMKRVK